MDLVLFKDALEHVCRIHRILRQPRGNALLVGIGGSGRKSLARLASFMANCNIFQIEIRKNFREHEFREKLKELYPENHSEFISFVLVFCSLFFDFSKIFCYWCGGKKYSLSIQ